LIVSPTILLILPHIIIDFTKIISRLIKVIKLIIGKVLAKTFRRLSNLV